MALISYWIIGLPVGYILSYNQAFGPFGYWIGLLLGWLLVRLHCCCASSEFRGKI